MVFLRNQTDKEGVVMLALLRTAAKAVALQEDSTRSVISQMVLVKAVFLAEVYLDVDKTVTVDQETSVSINNVRELVGQLPLQHHLPEVYPQRLRFLGRQEGLLETISSIPPLPEDKIYNGAEYIGLKQQMT
tara:strand:+ start:255 stop:650 length:396 start_codon:yes stop_codon:yes gene_type:complete